jgi:elongation of very long chain fatty acids protein 6
MPVLSRGKPYYPLYETYPQLEFLYSDYEKTYNPDIVLDIMKQPAMLWVPIVAIAAYLAMCYFGTKIMKDRKPFDLRGPLALWNLFLATFSAWGMIKTVPHMLHLIATKEFDQTVCDRADSWGGPGTGLAVQLFCLSKIPELVDTFFIVIRKKPLIFLHWYHHVTVLAFCWHSYVTESGAGLYFIAMNYTVHAVMYFYYFLQAIKMVPKWFPTIIITIMQISQMVVGTTVVCYSIYFKNYGSKHYPEIGSCNVEFDNLVVGGIIYASYLYLFVEFFVKRYLFSAPKKAKPTKAE